MEERIEEVKTKIEKLKEEYPEYFFVYGNKNLRATHRRLRYNRDEEYRERVKELHKGYYYKNAKTKDSH